MTVTTEMLREAVEQARAMPLYDHRGRRILRRNEWEQLPRRRRWWDIARGGVPPKPYRYRWERED